MAGVITRVYYDFVTQVGMIIMGIDLCNNGFSEER
jgi:hypothetical protein